METTKLYVEYIVVGMETLAVIFLVIFIIIGDAFLPIIKYCIKNIVPSIIMLMYIIPTSGWSTIPLTRLWAIRIWQRMCCKRCFYTLPKIFQKFIEKTVTNSPLISLVVVEAVHTICFASSEKNHWKKSRTHQMMPRCRMMQ